LLVVVHQTWSAGLCKMLNVFLTKIQDLYCVCPDRLRNVHVVTRNEAYENFGNSVQGNRT